MHAIPDDRRHVVAQRAHAFHDSARLEADDRLVERNDHHTGALGIAEKLPDGARAARERQQLRGQLTTARQLSVLEHEAQESMRPLERERGHSRAAE